MRRSTKAGYFVVALWAAGCSATAAYAANLRKPADCVAAVRDKPTLNKKLLPSAHFGMVTEAFGSERDAKGRDIDLTLRHGVETAQLKNGVELRVNLGGCETYSNTYEFTLPGLAAKSADGAFWLRRASELLAEIAPANLDKVVPLNKLSAELARRSKQPKLVGTFPKDSIEDQFGSGEFAPTYTVELNQRGSAAVLVVGYGENL